MHASVWARRGLSVVGARPAYHICIGSLTWRSSEWCLFLHDGKVFMHGLSLRSRRAARLSLRSQNRLNRALSSVVEPLEQRTLLTAGQSLGDHFTDFGPGNTETGGQVVALADGKFLQVGLSATFESTQFALARFNANGSNDE